MRKYQQLLLLLISCASIAVLLIYRSENTRLKYVLKVVNFFGRNDALIENATKIHKDDHHFAYPLPVWQLISSDFFAYSGYWHENQLVAGGEAIVIVVAPIQAVINFRCSVQFEGAHIVQGKFGFQRIEMETNKIESDFGSYLFFCKIQRKFGRAQAVAFSEDNSKFSAKWLQLRNTSLNAAVAAMTICLNLATNSNETQEALHRNSTNLLQFVLHHNAVGVEHFLIYNGFEIHPDIMYKLQTLNAQINALPFNFPFELGKSSENQQFIQKIVETDCLLRNLNNARYTILLEPNEFFIPNAHFSQPQSVIHSLKHYDNQLTHFELPLFGVCIENSMNKLLIDNQKYDPEMHFKQKIYILRPHVPLTTSSTSSRMALPLSQVLAHRYTQCIHIGADGLHQWNTGLREDFLLHLKTVRMKVRDGLNALL